MMNDPNFISATAWRKQLAEQFEPLPEVLIPALQFVQRQAGYLPREAISGVAQFLRVPEAKVFGVASFYSLFHMKPRGRKQITVCRGTACHVRGSARLLAELESVLGVPAGGTTPDMAFSLETVACLGSCALAPVVVLDKVYGRQTSASVRRLAESPASSGGETVKRLTPPAKPRKKSAGRESRRRAPSVK